MSRGSVFRYRQKDLDPQQTVRELKVDAVMVGKIAQRRDSVVLSAELVKVEDGSHLWGEQYERKTADLLALQQQIAGDLSQRLRPQLSRDEKEKMAKPQTRNAEAYQLYVKGRYFFDRWQEKDRIKAAEYFQQASPRIRLMPRPTPAWQIAARSWVFSEANTQPTPMQKAWRRPKKLWSWMANSPKLMPLSDSRSLAA
jgi:hypothetical protein